MATLNYADLLAEVEAKGLTLEHPDGNINFRPLDGLPGPDLKKMLKLVDIVQDEKISTETKLDTMDLILIASSDQKDRAKALLAEMPLSIKQTLFTEWSGGEEQGNS